MSPSLLLEGRSKGFFFCIFIMCMCRGQGLWWCVHLSTGAPSTGQRCQTSLELKLQEVAKLLLWVLGIEQYVFLTASPSLQPQEFLF